MGHRLLPTAGPVVWHRASRVLVVLLVGTTGRIGAQQVGDTVTSLDTIRVEVTRVRSEGVPLLRLPFAAHLISGDELERSMSSTPVEALDDLAGVSTASQFGSELQPDLRIRGFQVGPVVGFPQSVSVFVDGVRVNEPDASQVNFDLLPLQAVERVEVIRSPGGAFGRNTLGGAVNLVTRRGGGPPRGSIETALGSFGTARVHGWASGGVADLDVLLSGRYYRTEGWRDLSGATIREVFGKVAYTSGDLDGWLSYTFADNRIQGPGSLPRSWLRGRLPSALGAREDPRRLQYTGFEGDAFEPRLHFLVGRVERAFGEGTDLQVQGHLRSNRVAQSNDNITEPNVRGETDMISSGLMAQVVHERPSGATWSGGAEVVREHSDIRIFEVANPAFPDAGGLTEDVGSQSSGFGLFGHLWWPISQRVGVTGTIRWDRVSIPLRDRLDPENDGDNVFHEASGSAGLDLFLAGTWRAFASYGRGFRPPVLLELACADPEDPCPLPFELGADPPLDPVTADTWQVGVRRHGAAVSAEIAGYISNVHDDLFNVVLPPSTHGYFRNLDRTRRRGVEASAEWRPADSFETRVSGAWTEATFQSQAVLSSALVEDDDEEEGGVAEPAAGAVHVEPGDLFAMVPELQGAVGASWRHDRVRIDLELSYVGHQFYVGDEDNDAIHGRLQPRLLLDGSGEIGIGDATFWLRGRNLLDDEHATFGIISPNVRGPDEAPQPFLTPGLPFRLEAGVRWRFGKSSR